MSNQDFVQVCDQFMQHGKVFKNFQPATIHGYRDIFGLFVKSTGISTLDQLSTEMIEWKFVGILNFRKLHTDEELCDRHHKIDFRRPH